MSYEGYEQCICSNGHYFQQPADISYVSDKCPKCGAKADWHNSVDQTNGGNQGHIPFSILEEKFLLSPIKTETCPTCSNCRRTEEAVFRIPTKEETQPLRQYEKGI